jgi:hypothetical protein
MNDIIRIRASSLSRFADCPRAWKAEHLDGKRRPQSVPAHIGTSLHGSTAVFDAARISGDTVTADDAAGVFVDHLYHPEEEVVWGGESRRKAEATGLTLLTRYCADWSPRFEWEAVELPLEPLQIAFDDLGVTLELTGTLDRVLRTGDQRSIKDIKTGARAVDRDGEARVHGHGLQLGTYEILYAHTTGLECNAPAGVLGFQTAGKAQIGAGEVERPRDALIGTAEEPGLLEYVAKMISHDIWPGNPQSWLCGPRFCPDHPKAGGSCPFAI